MFLGLCNNDPRAINLVTLVARRCDSITEALLMLLTDRGDGDAAIDNDAAFISDLWPMRPRQLGICGYTRT